jgi:hypothetical protein
MGSSKPKGKFMVSSMVTKRKADAISNGAFLIGLGILLFTNAWWPGILLVLWTSLFLRQYLTGRFYDAFMSTFILIGLFIIAFIKINWSVLIPVLFVIGGIYLIFREYFYAEETLEEETLDETEDEKRDK